MGMRWKGEKQNHKDAVTVIPVRRIIPFPPKNKT